MGFTTRREVSSGAVQPKCDNACFTISKVWVVEVPKAFMTLIISRPVR